MGTSSMRLTQMTGRHQPVTQVDLPHQTQRTALNINPLQGLDLGECDLLKQLVSHLGLLHIIPEVLEMIHLALTTS